MIALSDEDKEITMSLSMVQVCVQDMQEQGMSPTRIAVALAIHMNEQVSLAIPHPKYAQAFRRALIDEEMKLP